MQADSLLHRTFNFYDAGPSKQVEGDDQLSLIGDVLFLFLQRAGPWTMFVRFFCVSFIRHHFFIYKKNLPSWIFYPHSSVQFQSDFLIKKQWLSTKRTLVSNWHLLSSSTWELDHTATESDSCNILLVL